jgi:pimeloyl-ACP methyl ester carboxylesterase
MSKQRELESDEASAPHLDRSVLGVAEGCEFAEIEGVSLAWEESGYGVPVVCLHAAGHGSRDFRFLAQEAPSGCRLILLDWPGHGRSAADAHSFTVEHCVDLLGGFLNALGLRSAVLLGSEFGAAVALSFAMHHPSRVRGLVLCQPEGLLAAVPQRGSQRFGRAVRRRARLILHRPPDTLAESEARLIAALQAQHALQHNQASLSVLALEDTLRAGLAQGMCPILIALAAASPAYPLKPLLSFLEPILSVTPIDQPGRPKLAIFSGRHSPLWESPARLARVLSGFATSTVALDAHSHSWTLAATDWPARGMNQWLCTHPGCQAAQSLPIEENPNRALRRR